MVFHSHKTRTVCYNRKDNINYTSIKENKCHPSNHLHRQQPHLTVFIQLSRGKVNLDCAQISKQARKKRRTDWLRSRPLISTTFRIEWSWRPFFPHVACWSRFTVVVFCIFGSFVCSNFLWLYRIATHVPNYEGWSWYSEGPWTEQVTLLWKEELARIMC